VGSAALVLVGGATPVRPEPVLFETMLAGWRCQQLSRRLRSSLIEGRERLVRRFATTSRWLFPGLLPGRPITAKRLADRLRTLGIPTQAARRATLTDLAAQLPAAVLADLFNLHPTTAVKWMRQAGGDWTRYAAAELTRTRHHQPRE
jgi:hypothetical protein